MTLNWVIGEGGLLGSAIRKRLVSQGQAVFSSSKIRWGNTKAINDLTSSLTNFLEQSQGSNWSIYWCAGAGVTNTTQDELLEEINVFRTFLEAIALKNHKLLSHGSILFSSSAGAVYGGSSCAPFTEKSIPTPLGDYGESKLQAEKLIQKLSKQTSLRCGVARISNIYGPGQNINKPQGLISRLAVASFTREPVSIYVSFDTLRDYIFVEDCASKMIAFQEKLRATQGKDLFHIKIISSGASVSIGEILGIFNFLPIKNPLIVAKETSLTSLQSRDLRLKSEYWTDLDSVPIVSLPVGINETVKDVETNFLQVGRLVSTNFG